MAPSSPQPTGIQHIQTNIYIGTVTTASPTNTAFTTLSHGTQYVCSNQQLLKQENQHILTALCRCNYPDWEFHRLQSKLEFQLSQKLWHNNTNLHKNNNRNHNTFLVVPYSKGLSESFRNICGKAGVQVHFKGANTVKELLVAPKDKNNIIQKGEVTYRYRCNLAAKWNVWGKQADVLVNDTRNILGSPLSSLIIPDNRTQYHIRQPLHNGEGITGFH